MTHIKRQCWFSIPYAISEIIYIPSSVSFVLPISIKLYSISEHRLFDETNLKFLYVPPNIIEKNFKLIRYNFMTLLCVSLDWWIFNHAVRGFTLHHLIIIKEVSTALGLTVKLCCILADLVLI